MIVEQRSIVMSTPEVLDNALTLPTEEQQWREFLKSQEAIFDNEGVVGYGATTAASTADPQQALTGATVCDLTHYGVIEVSGSDRQKFLQDLFTSDVALLSSEQSQYSAWCDAKGRVLATFWLLVRDDTIVMLLSRHLVPTVVAKLRMFVLRAKVSVTDRSADYIRVGLSGSAAGAALSEVLGVKVPSTPGASVTVSDSTVVCMLGEAQSRWLLIGHCEQIKKRWISLRPYTQTIGRDAWALLNIRDKLPDIVAATSGEFIPQMLGLEALGALCFTKGCYPGQEVIARLQYRGKLTRKLVPAFAEPQAKVTPGSPIHSDAGEESAVVGRVVNVAVHPDNRLALLCVIQIEALDSDLHLGEIAGPKLLVA